MLNNNLKSFKLVIKPGDRQLRNSDYWAIITLCSVGAFTLLFIVGGSI
mgnify:CR=1|jgi:hypothetical protein